MKTLLFFTTWCLLLSCGNRQLNPLEKRYIVETTAHLTEGSTDLVLQLFKSTNPDLVREEKDWIRATFSSIEDEDVVIVRAEWKSKAAYLKFADSDEFKTTMRQFGKYFKRKPEVRISQVLFEM